VSPRALVVDDDAGMRFMLRDALVTAGLDVDEAQDGLAALERIGAGGYHLVITDLRMPRLDGLSLLRRLREMPSAPRVVLITAHGSEQHIVEALRLGVFDYLRKPCPIAELMAVVARATEDVRLRLENERLAGELALSHAVVLRSSAMEELAVLVARAARRDVTVLVTGESGTGKERIAEAIVGGSRRAGQPFVRFNCAALTPDLAEAELFGHTKGAFTGAQRARPGLFREAHLGTLLLDEIGELHPALQAKLLRVLQEGEVRPVGEERSVKVDVRVIASTHRDLGAMASAGTFRPDLFYRLDVVRLHVPPLRERPEDIRTLAEQFCARFSRQFEVGPLRPSPELLAALAARPWPGNVRELENTIERMVALSDGETLDLRLIDGSAAPRAAPAAGVVAGDAAPNATPGPGLRAQVEAFERRLLIEAMAEARGNQAEAARLLSIGRATMHDKLRKHGIND
jgi:two-component system, NtrC family, response regulator HydG